MEDDILIVPSGTPDSYCRLCLSETNVEALLVAGSFPQSNQILVDLIKRHVEIGLSASTDSPCGICSTCRMMLEEFERFRERCLRCDYVLTGIERSQHGQVLPFECAQCPSKFRFKSEFERHWKSIHDLYYRCDSCEAGFSKESMLNDHTVQYHGRNGEQGVVERYHCSYCPRIFPNDQQLQFHVQVLHETEKSPEEIVPPVKKKRQARAKPTSSEPEPVMVSINIENSQQELDQSYKPYECKTCRVRFHFIGSLTRHINDKHASQKSWKQKKKSAPAVPVEEPRTTTPMVVEEPILEPVMPALAIPTSSTNTVAEMYNQFPIPNEPEYIPELIPPANGEQFQYMNYGEQAQSPLVYPCVVLMERLDQNLVPPILNHEIPLGKFYHALQMQAKTAVEDPIDEDILKNYPNYTSKVYKRYRCDICSVELASKLGLNRHKQYKHSSNVYTCNYCGRQFHNKGGLDRHMYLHTNDFPHVCDECPMGFARVGLLNKHKEKCHVPGAPPQDIHYCPFCPRAFNKLSTIKNHVTLLHREHYVMEDVRSSPVEHTLLSVLTASLQ